MPLLQIGGIQVDFPKEPYPSQVRYMEHVIRALNNNQNALLESPTGTGKTLCLLCATLAWQASQRASSGMNLMYSERPSMIPTIPGMMGGVPMGGMGGGLGGPGAGPRASAPHTIVYASRTHSQLAQVVGELRETSYKPRMTVLGSREQLCVHEKISKLKAGVINHACNSLNSKRGCMYRNNLDNYINSSNASLDNTSMMDIEEMVKLGNHRKICPYFHSREFSTSSDIVLLPYNYLLDSSIRKSLKLEWDKCIVIFDEAHNLERVAADAASFSLSSVDIALCIQELQSILRKLKEESENQDKTPSELEALKKLLVNGKGESTVPVTGVAKPSMSVVVLLLKAMFELEKRVDALNLPPPSSYVGGGGGGGGFQAPVLPGTVHEGVWLLQLLVQSGFHSESMVDELRKGCHLLMEAQENAMDGEVNAGGVVEPTLQKFTQALDRVLRSAKAGNCADYKCYVCDEEIKEYRKKDDGTGSGSKAANSYSSLHSGVEKRRRRMINYWCFSTGVAMSELQGLGVKSLLLTSGTLSPMQALKEDIKLPFPIQLENPHVIGDKQMWVGALPVGVLGTKLNSSFASRDTVSYQDELGQSILQVVLTMTCKTGSGSTATTDGDAGAGVGVGGGIGGWAAYGVATNLSIKDSFAPAPPVVKGGVLVFFPSYAVMERIITRWKESGLFDKLRNHVGKVLVEPRGSGTAEVEDNDKGKGGGVGDKGKGRGGDWRGGRKSSPPKANFMFANGGSGGSGGNGGNGGRGEPVAFHSIVTEFEAAVRTYGGCALMAVCRGKVSEGIDFADSKGRVVIITGIPFAPFMDPWVMLKKQHLDDKGKRADPAQAIDAAVSAAAYLGVGAAAAMAIDKSRGANAAVAGVVVHPGAFGRTIAPSAHAGVLARGAAGGFVSAAAMLASSNDAPPAPAPASAPGTSLYPAAYLAGQSSNYTNTNSNNSSSYPSYTAPAAPSLTGQAWYTQGALRAVNQAIGRVIRHNKDWGTVLLMDDRFMNDRQLSQLSSWVRPRVKKFTSFVTAMSSFRSFITAAALDKELAPRVRPDDQPPRILNRAYKPQVAPTNTFARHVEISADGIEQESTFIDPSLLATQPDGRSAGGGGRMEGDSEQALLSLFQRNRSEGEGGQGGYAEADVLSVYDVDGDEEGGTASSMYDAFSRSRAKSAPPAPPAPPTNSLNSLNSGYSVNSGSRDSSGDGGGPSAARSAQWPPSRDEYPAALERRALSTSTSASASASATTSAGVLRGQGQGGQGSMPAPTRTMTAPKVSSFGIGNKTSFAEMGIAKAKQAGQAEKVSGKESGLFNIFNPRSQPQPQPSASTQPAKPSLSLSQISQQASQRQGRVGGAGVREVNDAMLEFNEQVANLRELVDGPSLKVVKDALRMAKHVKTLSQMKPLAERLILLLQSVEREAAFHALASFAAVLPPDVAGGYLDMVNSAIDVQALLAEREREWEEQRGRKRARVEGVSRGASKGGAGAGAGTKGVSSKAGTAGAGAGRAVKTELSDKELAQRNIDQHIKSVLLESRQSGEISGVSSLSQGQSQSQSQSHHQSHSQSQYSQSEGPGDNKLRSVASKRAKFLLSASLAGVGAGTGTGAGGGVPSQKENVGRLSAGLAALKSQGPGQSQRQSQSQTQSQGQGLGVVSSFASRLAQLDKKQLAGCRVARLGPGVGASASASGDKSKQFSCGACHEAAEAPCAGRCGHVCCQVCWTKWLRVKKSCPICREPADILSITRVSIKK